MGAAFAVYAALLLLVAGPLGNHGLWLAFTLFLVARAAGQALLLPRLERRTFGLRPPRPCFAEIDLMISRCGALGSIGQSACASASAISASMRGSSNASGVCSRTWRTRLPSPLSRPCGIGQPPPQRKQSVTQRGITASDRIASPAFSVGPKPIASAL